MKKIISLLMVVAMFASIAAVNVSAAGQILFQETFDSGEFDPANWILGAGANNYWIEDGIAKADRNAMVLQSYYGDDYPKKTWDYASFSADFMLYDFDSDADEHLVGLWWKDYQLADGEFPDENGWIGTGTVYTLAYNVESHTLSIMVDVRQMAPEEEETTVAEGETTETTTTVETEDGSEGDYEFIGASVAVPEEIEVKMDYFKPSVHTLGMRVTPNAIYGFFDGQHLLTYKTPTVIGDKQASPLLLINDDMMVGFDNVTVATNDYDGLFGPINPNLGQETNVAPTPTTPPETVIETQKVMVTDIETNADGETIIVTREEIVSNVVTVPVADTNTGGSIGGTGAATGDMMFVVIAVMVVAIGSAIVVKKVHVK